jgi:hypothetical protein
MMSDTQNYAVVKPPNRPSVAYRVEIAATPEARELGFQNRTYLEPHRGMVFLFPHDQYVSFWMRDTLIPLDIIFVDVTGRVLRVVHSAAPRSDQTHTSLSPVRFVIELAGGAARRTGIVPGAMIELTGDLPAVIA